VSNDPYDNKGTLSVTTLLKAPYQRLLEVKHKDEIVEDVSDRIYSLLGQSVHHILERAGSEDDLVEKRFFTEIGGEKVSGQLDLLEADGTLCDFKVTSIWAVKAAMQDGKDEWEEQLNMLAYLARQDGHDVKCLRIIAICRDWSPSGKTRDGDAYPQRVESIEFDLWDEARQLAFMEARVAAHINPIPPPCTDKECWTRDSVWAVHKKGRKSAMKLEPTEEAAVLWCTSKGHAVDEGGIYLEERIGERIRCESYCSVAPFCSHFTVTVKQPTLRKL